MAALAEGPDQLAPRVRQASGSGGALLAPDQLDAEITAILLEFFDNGLLDEVLHNIDELDEPSLAPTIIQRAVLLALERSNDTRELVSKLIAQLTLAGQASRADVEHAFDLILSSIRDLNIDTPEASRLVAQFIARAVADDCIAPKFILLRLQLETAPPTPTEPGDMVPAELKSLIRRGPGIRETLRRAQVWLQMQHGFARLEKVWGKSGGTLPTDELKKQIHLLLCEYLDSLDCNEAQRCLHELNVPHFHHEVVYEAIVLALGAAHAIETSQQLCALLRSLYDAGVISTNQMRTGFQRAFDDLPDLMLDHPHAMDVIDTFLRLSVANGVLPPAEAATLPERSRKRMLSNSSDTITPPLSA